MPPRRKPVEQTRLSLDAIIADINKKHNDPGLLVRGSEMDQVIHRITTGVPGFDIALGGGLPVNQFHEIIGMESSAKTALTMAIVAANQALDPEWTCLWIAAEDFVPPWAAAAGVDLDRTIVMATNVMEEVYNTALTAMDNRAVDCIVIDSYPALVASAEDEQAMEEFAVGVGARLMGKFLRKGTRAQKRSLVEEDRACTCIIINQYRDKIGIMFGDPRTTPGGKAKNYHYFTRTEVKRDEILWAGEKKKSPQVGISVGMSVIKNKSHRPNATANVDFYVDDFENMHKARFDVPLNVFEMALAAEIITKSGAWYYFEGAQLGQGKDAAVETLRNDGATLTDVHHHLFAHHLPGVEVPLLPGVSIKQAPVKRAIKRKAS